MKTRLKNLRALVLITFIGSLLAISFKANAAYYYQLKIYHFKSKSQEDRIDHYLKMLISRHFIVQALPELVFLNPLSRIPINVSTS
jgi:hypothetical protein